MPYSLHGTYVSEKINKVRWRPDEFNNSHFFVTGSVDNDENTVKLWDFIEKEEDDIYPFSVSTYSYGGDVTEIKVLRYLYFRFSAFLIGQCLFSVFKCRLFCYLLFKWFCGFDKNFYFSW